MTAVTLCQVRKVHGPDTILHGFDLAIEPGELIVVVGPSGCGKSTLLRLIAGLDAPSGGDITLGGRRVNGLDPSRRDIAMVFQNYALYPHMSVFENMAYGLRLRGLDRTAIKGRVDWAAELLHLSPLLDRKPKQLSGGQRQRVAMGRALVRKPALFLFDEPLSNLDAQLRNEMRIEIKQLQQSLGITMLYVTHDQVEAMTLADRLVVLRAGRIEQVGVPMDLYERPDTLFVAGFLGAPSMNLVSVTTDVVGRLVLDRGGVWPMAVAGPPATRYRLGIRPEDIAVSATGAGLQGQVALIERLGADSIVHIRPNGGMDVLLARLQGPCSWKIGDQVSVNSTLEKLHFFDPDSERRLPTPIPCVAAGVC